MKPISNVVRLARQGCTTYVAIAAGGSETVPFTLDRGERLYILGAGASQLSFTFIGPNQETIVKIVRFPTNLYQHAIDVSDPVDSILIESVAVASQVGMWRDSDVPMYTEHAPCMEAP